MSNDKHITDTEWAICEKYDSKIAAVSPNGRIGIALKTMTQHPTNGLRHPPHGNMCGWYIWGGEYSADPNFFQVLHVEHIAKHYPDLFKLLSLEPGFRFLIDGTYLDVWFDEQLLNI